LPREAFLRDFHLFNSELQDGKRTKPNFGSLSRKRNGRLKYGLKRPSIIENNSVLEMNNDDFGKKIKFGPASKDEEFVFGAQRPGYRPSYDKTPVALDEVNKWIRYMKFNNIKRVVCLEEEKLHLYSHLPGGLLGIYYAEFGKNNVLHCPIKEGKGRCTLLGRKW